MVEGVQQGPVLVGTFFTHRKQQYIDNMATLNERQFFLLPPRNHTKSWVSQGAPSNQEISGVSSSLRGCSGTPPFFLTLHSSAVSRSPVQAINKNMPQQSHHSR